MHEGLKYACVQCYYKTAFKGNPINRVRAMHEGLIKMSAFKMQTKEWLKSTFILALGITEKERDTEKQNIEDHTNTNQGSKECYGY